MRSAFIAGLMALWCLGCEPGPPSREDVSTLVTEEFKQPGYDRKLSITLAYASTDREGRTLQARADRQRKECLDALLAAGLVTEPKYAGIDRFGYRSASNDVFVWIAGPTDTARPFIVQQWKHALWDHFQVPAIEVVSAMPELLGVTGITAPTEGFGPSFVEAQFSHRLALTPFGRAISTTKDCSGRDQLPSGDVAAGVVSFHKFDDGWRPGALLGNYGVPLKQQVYQ